MPYLFANSGRYSSTSSMFASVVTMTSCGAFSKTRPAAFPAIADRRTLLSAATLLIVGEVTLDLLFGYSLRSKLLGDVCGHVQKQLATDLEGQLFRVPKRIEHRRAFSLAIYEHRLVAIDELTKASPEVADRGRF